MNFWVQLFVTALAIYQSDARWFIRGRSRGGNNALPPTTPEDVKHLFDSKWFIQKLDHFNPTDSREWKQKYFVNDEYFEYSHPGPVFLMIGGEGKASAKWMNAGQWIEYAKSFRALCFQLEHRFYGDSHPTRDMSVKNLIYLTSEQALGDIAAFIVSMNSKYKFDSNTKWIVFGGSYPGSLAAWMRLKYPHLVHGAVSSSGPLLAKADFMEYYQVVASAISQVTGSDNCINAIKKATLQIDSNIKTNVGRKILDAQFRLCDSLINASDLDMTSFYESLASNFAGIVQYNKDNRIGESAKTANITIDYVCRIMTDSGAGAEYKRVAEINSLLLDSTEEQCLDYKYSNLVTELRNDSWASSASEGGRQWFYQTCTEFGFFQTSSGEPELFGNRFTYDFFIQQCKDIFGNRFNADYLDDVIQRTNMIYGALDLEVNRIVFVHGSVDPWHALGITQTLDNGAPAIYIEGTAHCANMYPSRDEDLPQLKESRLEIKQFITGWLDTIS